MHELLRFQPLYQERVWGGRALETALGRALPAGGLIGESWEIVDRSEAQSVVESGTMGGKSLRSVLARYGAEVMGPAWPAGKPFPILVKWLDCRERLSLQVHPPVSVAAELKGEPKTENWYIAHSSPGVELIVGLKRGVTRALFERAIADNAVEQCVHHFNVAAGDSILVHSGQVHAIDAGFSKTPTPPSAFTTGAAWGATACRASSTSRNRCARSTGRTLSRPRCARRRLPA